MTETLRQQAQQAMAQLLELANLEAGDIVVLGCSTSEVAGHRIGTLPGPEIAAALLEGLLPETQARGLYLAVQCCEHLNRALVVEHAALKAHGLVRVNALPQPKAGGSAATAAWQRFDVPILAEAVTAGAGLDVGNTLIGMHLRPVAIPVRLETARLGQAPLVAARTRPRFIGGVRAVYQQDLL